MVMASSGAAHGSKPVGGTAQSSKAQSGGAGYARAGFHVHFYFDRPRTGERRGAQPKALSDPASLKHVVNVALARLRSGAWRTQFMYNPLITKYIPFFQLQNYVGKEKKAMMRLHPHPGGTLIRSGMVIPTGTNWETGDMIVTFQWSTPYLGYLVRHGVARPGPPRTPRFWPLIRAANYLQVAVRNVLTQVARRDIGSRITRWVHQQNMGEFYYG